MASPKQVRCVICGKEVNKRQTLVINDKGDRACRIHEATQQDAEVVQKKQAEKAKAQKRLEHRKHRHPAEDTKMKQAECWVCNRPGISERDFYYRVLLAMHKSEVYDGKKALFFTPEGAEAIRKHIKNPLSVDDREMRCLLKVKISDGKALLKKMDHLHRKAAEWIGGLIVCEECADKNGIELPINKVTPEQMKMGVVLSTVMEADLKEQAKDEVNAQKAVDIARN